MEKHTHYTKHGDKQKFPVDRRADERVRTLRIFIISTTPGPIFRARTQNLAHGRNYLQRNRQTNRPFLRVCTTTTKFQHTARTHGNTHIDGLDHKTIRNEPKLGRRSSTFAYKHTYTPDVRTHDNYSRRTERNRSPVHGAGLRRIHVQLSYSIQQDNDGDDRLTTTTNYCSCLSVQN